MTNQNNLRGILQNNTPPARTKILSQEQFEIDFAEYLENLERNPQPSPSETTPTNSRINKSDYLQIPNSNLLISRFELPNFNNLNYQEAHFKLEENNLFMPSPEIFMPHFLNIIEAYKGNTKIYDANSKELLPEEVEEIYKHLTEDHKKIYQDGGFSGAWTWLDAEFVKEANSLKLKTNTRVKDGNLESQVFDLDSLVTESGLINLNFNSQGFPQIKSPNQSYEQGGNLYFYPPTAGRVARFVAYSDGAYLDCNGVPSFRDSSLGVFGVCEAEELGGPNLLLT